MPRKYLILIHLTFWVFKIGTSSLMFTIPQVNEDTNLIYFISKNMGEWLITIAWFYFNYAVVVPKLLLKNKYFLFFVAELGLCYFNFIFKSISWNDFDLTHMWWPQDQLFGPLSYNTVLYITISPTFRLMNEWLSSSEERSQLETALKNAELSFLNYQISPHFLFNTMNNIYGLALKEKPKTNTSISSLRYLLQINNRVENYHLQDEIKAIKSFIKLNQLRYAVQVVFNTSIVNNPKIDPMIFLPFFENAFKHGDKSSKSTITAVLTEHKGKIGFTISNIIAEEHIKDSVGGIGIENVKKRLQLRYPDKHTIKIDSRNKSFTINININAN